MVHALIQRGAIPTSAAARPRTFVHHQGADLSLVHVGRDAASAAPCRADLVPAEVDGIPHLRFIRFSVAFAVVATGALCARVQRFARPRHVGTSAIDAARRHRAVASSVWIVDHVFLQQWTSVASRSSECDAAADAELLARPSRRAVSVQAFVGRFASVRGGHVDLGGPCGRCTSQERRAGDEEGVHGDVKCVLGSSCGARRGSYTNTSGTSTADATPAAMEARNVLFACAGSPCSPPCRGGRPCIRMETHVASSSMRDRIRWDARWDGCKFHQENRLRRCIQTSKCRARRCRVPRQGLLRCHMDGGAGKTSMRARSTLGWELGTTRSKTKER